MKSQTLVIFACLFFLDLRSRSILTEATLCDLTFKDCGSEVGNITRAQFNGTCVKKQGIALLRRGTTVLIDFTFSAHQVEANLTSKVEGKIGVLPYVNFPLGNPDGCKDSGLSCPIKANTTLDYLPKLNVLSEYPKVSVIVKWQLQNAAKRDIFCATLLAEIVD